MDSYTARDKAMCSTRPTIPSPRVLGSALTVATPHRVKKTTMSIPVGDRHPQTPTYVVSGLGPDIASTSALCSSISEIENHVRCISDVRCVRKRQKVSESVRKCQEASGTTVSVRLRWKRNLNFWRKPTFLTLPDATRRTCR